jgi:hypothetical protein
MSHMDLADLEENMQQTQIYAHHFQQTTNDLKALLKTQRSNKYLAMMLTYGVIIIPLAVISIILGTLAPGNCDNKDDMGINVATYLLTGGIVGLVVNVIVAFNILISWRTDMDELSTQTKNVIKIYSLFSFCWFIIGAVILFRSNISCINSHSSHVIFALVMWCINALSMFKVVVFW